MPPSRFNRLIWVWGATFPASRVAGILHGVSFLVPPKVSTVGVLGAPLRSPDRTLQLRVSQEHRGSMFKDACAEPLPRPEYPYSQCNSRCPPGFYFSLAQGCWCVLYSETVQLTTFLTPGGRGPAPAGRRGPWCSALTGVSPWHSSPSHAALRAGGLRLPRNSDLDSSPSGTVRQWPGRVWA